MAREAAAATRVPRNVCWCMQNAICKLSYFEAQQIVPANIAIQYGTTTERAAYSVGAILTFKQVRVAICAHFRVCTAVVESPSFCRSW